MGVFMGIYIKKGRCVGARHPKAKLTDSQIKQLREMYTPYVIGYGQLAAKFGCAPSTVRDICQYRTRKNAI